MTIKLDKDTKESERLNCPKNEKEIKCIDDIFKLIGEFGKLLFNFF